MDVEKESREIKERNTRVEADKAWETSAFRKILILIVTYILASFTMYVIGVSNFLLSALVPTFGFFLSTLTFPIIKTWWISRNLK